MTLNHVAALVQALEQICHSFHHSVSNAGRHIENEFNEVFL